MLATRLWMGTVLIALVIGILIGDERLPPWFPFLFLFQLGLTSLACFEFIQVLGANRPPQRTICYLGVVAFVLANWLVNCPCCQDRAWSILLGVQTVFLLIAFLYEMAVFFGPGRSVERIALTWFIVGYLGLLPSFFAQIRWFSSDHQANSVRLALAIFVPKCCDIGAYFTGRLLGKHRMTPVLSPKKTWEGALGGLTWGIASAIAIDQLAPSHPLKQDLLWEVGFGLTVALAGMLGDLAESLVKRDCETKDASAVVPGFGGVLDVVDAIIFSAPVSYMWFYMMSP